MISWLDWYVHRVDESVDNEIIVDYITKINENGIRDIAYRVNAVDVTKYAYSTHFHWVGNIAYINNI